MKNKKWKQFEKLTEQCYMNMIGADKDGDVYKRQFPESATLEEYLCYTGDDDHNAMVSRFLSVVRKEQRDRLEWLRVWGCLLYTSL